jgi:hypothetical protein
VDTHANPLVPLANDLEPTTLDTYGLGSELPLASYDPNTQFWKTSEDICLWGDYKSLESLPKSGMTRNGVLFRQPDWVRLIDETGLLSWPTPRASAAMADSPEAIMRNLQKKGYKSKLEQAVQMRPISPRAAQAEVRNQNYWQVEPDVGRVANGVSARVDRLRGLGNAVVPQVAEYIGRLVMAAELNNS